MPNFDNACIYKIQCKDPSVKDIYIGSTCDFIVRKRGHSSRCNNPNCPKRHYKLYQYIRDNGGWDNWNMVKICDVTPCVDKDELHKVECDYYNKLNPTLNGHTPQSTRKETCDRYLAKPGVKKKRSDWYQKNKEVIKKRSLDRYYAKKKLISLQSEQA